MTIDLTADEVAAKPNEAAAAQKPNEAAAAPKPAETAATPKAAATAASRTDAASSELDANNDGKPPEPGAPARPAETAARQSAASASAASRGGPSRPGAAARAVPPPPPEPSRSYLVVGLVGAALALAVIALIAGARLFGSGAGPEVEALSAQVAELRDDLDALGETGAAADSGRDERIAALRQTVDELAALPRDDPAAALQELDDSVSGLNQRVGGIEEQLATLGGRIDAAETGVAGLAALTPRLETLERAIEAGNAGGAADGDGNSVALAALAQRIERLERAAPTASDISADADPLEAIRPELAALGAGVAAVEARVTTLEARDPADLGPLTDAVATLRDDLSTLSDRLSAVDPTERIEALAATVRDADARAGRAVESAAAVAPAIAALSLADAIAAGRPFPVELQAARRHGADAPELEEIAPHAETGLPTLASLVASFQRLLPSLLRGTAEPGEDAGTLDRLIGSIRDLIDVRPSGPIEGDDTFAIVSRMSARLADGDLAGALAERQGLPEEEQAITSGWAGQAAARVAGDRLAERMREAAIARLAGGDGQ